MIWPQRTITEVELPMGSVGESKLPHNFGALSITELPKHPTELLGDYESFGGVWKKQEWVCPTAGALKTSDRAHALSRPEQYWEHIKPQS